MRRLSPFAFLLGLLLFYFLLRLVDLPASLSLLRSVSPFWLVMAFLTILPEILLKSWRIHQLAVLSRSPLSYKHSVWIYLAGQPVSAVTPAKLGDVTRVLGLSRWGHLSAPSAFALHAADKVYDLLTLGLLAGIGLINLVLQTRNQTPAAPALLGIALGILLMGLFLNPKWMRSTVKPVLLFLAPAKLTHQIQTHGHEFYQRLQELFQPLSRVVGPFLLSLLAWETAFTRAYICALALGLPLSFLKVALIIPIVVVVEFLPISIMGLGLREAALFIFLASDKLPLSSLLSYSLLMFLVGPLFVALLGIPAAMKLGALASKKP
jgi:uncharacterized protein (TIRG00374 family)